MLVASNACEPIFSNPSLRVTWDKLLQLRNASLSISLTELGMVIDDMLAPQNAVEQIFSNPSLRVTLDRL